MNWNDFSSAKIKIEYANMSKMNKIRAWARKNHAIVNVSRYARDAYEGTVSIPMKTGREQQLALINDLKAIL